MIIETRCSLCSVTKSPALSSKLKLRYVSQIGAILTSILILVFFKIRKIHYQLNNYYFINKGSGKRTY